ncbi:MAG: Gfo/Idh/MocA family oxidoreductase [Acidobacteriaceae bacterium]
MALGKTLVNGRVREKTGKAYDGVTGYSNCHDLLANKDIDTVVISTPDHQHAIVTVDAVRAGKDVSLQKPVSLTFAEGRYLSDRETKRASNWLEVEYETEIVWFWVFRRPDIGLR